MSGGYTNTNQTQQRTKKKKSTGTSAILKNKLRTPGMKVTEWRSKSGERWSVAAANVQEKMTHWSASMKLGFFTATHPVHPLRREAAKQAMLNKKIAATERKVQKVSAAHSRAAAKRARARETRVAQLNQAVH